MRTGLKKWQKTTEIYFSEAKDPITISTFNTSLKNRLTEFAKEYPELCKLVADDEMGCLTFEINKENFTFRVMKPASDKKREKSREQMKKLRGKTEESSAMIKRTRNQYGIIQSHRKILGNVRYICYYIFFAEHDAFGVAGSA